MRCMNRSGERCELKPAEACENCEWIIDGVAVAFNRPANQLALALEPLRVEAGPASNRALSLDPCQHTRQCGGRGGVADPDLADHQTVGVEQLTREPAAGGDRAIAIIRPH